MQPILPREQGVSPVQMWILLILSEGPNYGYNVIQRLDEMFSGFWKPKAGTVYPAIEKLMERRLITVRVEHRDDAPDRHYYTITPAGEKSLRSGMDRWGTMMEYIEEYGERHRAIRKGEAEMTREELGDLLVRFGESLKNGEVNTSEHLPSMKPETMRFPERLVYKFLYAYIEGGREIEIEIEWDQKD
jgi:PadR family transcriptional regulator, regulatory protein PadR